MLKFLRALLPGDGGAEPEKAPYLIVEESAPAEVIVDQAGRFPIANHITTHLGYPIVDWSAVWSWIDTLSTSDLKDRAWAACERAWLLHFRDALGPSYLLAERDQAAVLSSLEPNVLRATLDTMERMLRRILLVLDGIAQVPPALKDILIVFDDEHGYYEYASYYDHDTHELPFSGGRYISFGCSHFVTFKSDLRSIEPTIAHELTHGCVAHLPLPLWLNEGIAVNTERRVAGNSPSLYTAREMHQKHLGFWHETEIQQFWSGGSFARSDEGNSLSYDLARIIVEQFAKDWEGFRAFVLAADRDDGGARAAREHLGLDLGATVCALLEREPAGGWVPNPQAWERPQRKEH